MIRYTDKSGINKKKKKKNAEDEMKIEDAHGSNMEIIFNYFDDRYCVDCH